MELKTYNKAKDLVKAIAFLNLKIEDLTREIKPACKVILQTIETNRNFHLDLEEYGSCSISGMERFFESRVQLEKTIHQLIISHLENEMKTLKNEFEALQDTTEIDTDEHGS